MRAWTPYTSSARAASAVPSGMPCGLPACRSRSSRRTPRRSRPASATASRRRPPAAGRRVRSLRRLEAAPAVPVSALHEVLRQRGRAREAAGGRGTDPDPERLRPAPRRLRARSRASRRSSRSVPRTARTPASPGAGELHLGRAPVGGGEPAGDARPARPRGRALTGRSVPRRGGARHLPDQAHEADVQRGDLARWPPRRESTTASCSPSRRPAQLFFAPAAGEPPHPAAAGIALGKVGPFHRATVAWILRRQWLAGLMAKFFEPSLRGTYCSMAGEIQKGRTEIDNYNGHLLAARGTDRNAVPR